jgi:hypothetical protein
MLADPLVLIRTMPTALNNALLGGTGVAYRSFAATGRGPTSSTYRSVISSTNSIDCFVGHQLGKRERYTVRLTENELVANPVEPTKNSVKTSTIYIVVDRSLLGAGAHEEECLNAMAYLAIKPADVAALIQRVLARET